MRRIAVGLLCAFLLAGALGGVVTGHGEDGSVSADRDQHLSSGSDGTIESVLQMENITDTSFEITVFESGDGRWAIRQIQPLDSEQEVADFETVAQRFETEETETLQTFRERANRLTESGSSATGREMAAEAFERGAFVDERGQTTGVIVMSFRWTNIAVTESDSDQVVLADIFAGGWSILDTQRVVIRPGEQVVFASPPAPEPDAGLDGIPLSDAASVTYEGPAEFTDRQPRIVFEPRENQSADGAADDSASDDGTAGDTTTDDDSTDATTGDGEAVDDGEPDNSGGDMMLMAVVAVLLIGVGGSLAWYVSTRTSEETADTAGVSPSGEAAKEQNATTPDPELVADENRVIQLLEQNGGRMKQVEIVEETEWSKSKVSMLLSEMEEAELISKLRVGRENIISLAGEEPDAAGSPFKNED